MQLVCPILDRPDPRPLVTEPDGLLAAREGVQVKGRGAVPIAGRLGAALTAGVLLGACAEGLAGGEKMSRARILPPSRAKEKQ